jgi:hypothetical protein
VASVIAPLARDLVHQYRADRVHVTSGWRFGPHFDLRARSGRDCPIDWERVAAALADGAHRHPGPPELSDDEEYLRTATVLGQIESVPPPYLPRQPHGHTELVVSDPPPWAGRLGELRAQGLARLLPAVTATAATEPEGALLAQVAEGFLALADSHPHGMRFGTFSFRSHAEAFFHWAGPAANYRAVFERRLGKDRAVLEELVRRIHAGCPSALGAQWRNALNECLADLSDQVTEADLDQAVPVDAGPARRAVGSSAFHAAVAASGVIAAPPAWFAGYRFTINLFYQLLPALDVSPVRRFYLCHAIAECVDAVVGESWQTRLAALEARATLEPAR